MRNDKNKTKRMANGTVPSSSRENEENREKGQTRREFLRNSFFSLAYPSLMTSPLFRSSSGFLEGGFPNLQEKSEQTLAEKMKVPTRKDIRSFSLYNTHTGESLKNIVFHEGGKYIPGALKEVSKLFRDHRTGDVLPIDPKLLDLLHKIKQCLDTSAPFHLISGYRSPKTNAILQAQSCGVARQSQHCLGKAADIALPKSHSLRDIHKVAKSLGLGGVGIYRQFVHVDTGRVRYW